MNSEKNENKQKKTPGLAHFKQKRHHIFALNLFLFQVFGMLVHLVLLFPHHLQHLLTKIKQEPMTSTNFSRAIL